MPSIYRIERPSAIVAAADGAPPNGMQPRDLAERAVKLIPGDVLVLYATIKALFLPSEGLAAIAEGSTAALVLGWILPIGGLVLTASLRIWGTRPDGASALEKVQWPVVLIACLTYCGWIISQSEPVFGTTIDPKIGMAMLIVFGAVPPLFYKGEKV